ncbi:MAG: NUDIX hydrolase [Patescibacteria group bacterium]|nr:NUDIX hydrolase [Patescibacteria group bacterium]
MHGRRYKEKQGVAVLQSIHKNDWSDFPWNVEKKFWKVRIFVEVFSVEYKTPAERNGEYAGPRGPLGYLLVKNLYHSDPKWQLPGGRKCKEEKTPLETAVRKVLEETGIGAPAESFCLASSGECGGSKPFLFTLGMRTDNPHSLGRADLPESVTVFFSSARFYDLIREGQFPYTHFQALIDTATIIPLGDPWSQKKLRHAAL